MLLTTLPIMVQVGIGVAFFLITIMAIVSCIIFSPTIMEIESDYLEKTFSAVAIACIASAVLTIILSITFGKYILISHFAIWALLILFAYVADKSSPNLNTTNTPL